MGAARSHISGSADPPQRRPRQVDGFGAGQRGTDSAAQESHLGGAQRWFLARVDECTVQRNSVHIGAQVDQQRRSALTKSPKDAGYADFAPIIVVDRTLA